jgi:hypothetical protein
MDYAIRMRAYKPRTGPFSRLHHTPILSPSCSSHTQAVRRVRGQRARDGLGVGVGVDVDEQPARERAQLHDARARAEIIRERYGGLFPPRSLAEFHFSKNGECKDSK